MRPPETGVSVVLGKSLYSTFRSASECNCCVQTCTNKLCQMNRSLIEPDQTTLPMQTRSELCLLTAQSVLIVLHVGVYWAGVPLISSAGSWKVRADCVFDR